MINKLAQFIREAGGTAFLVGGAVRDELMGRESKDADVEVFNLTPVALESKLRAFAANNKLSFSFAGKSFQVYKLRDENGNEIDVSLPRADKKAGPGHGGFIVTADPFMTVNGAASRRDFTINAIYKNILTGKIHDPFNGQTDILWKTIRMVDKNAFIEDPLRVLRAVQFATRFEFTYDYETFLEMLKVDLSELPAERLFTEFEKFLLGASHPSRAFMWDKLNEKVFPEFHELRSVQQDKFYHPEGNVLIHTMMTLDRAAEQIRANPQLTRAEKLTVMLAVLCHDLGKATTTEVIDGRIRAHDHSKAGLKPTEKFLDRINVHTVDGFDVRGQVLALVEHHLKPPMLRAAYLEFPSTNVGRSLRRLAQKVRLDLLALVSLADMTGRGTSEENKDVDRKTIDWFREEAKKANVEKKPIEPILKGRHLLELGYKPSQEMGWILDKAFQYQLDGDLTNLDDGILFANLIRLYTDADVSLRAREEDWCGPDASLIEKEVRRQRIEHYLEHLVIKNDKVVAIP